MIRRTTSKISYLSKAADTASILYYEVNNTTVAKVTMMPYKDSGDYGDGGRYGEYGSYFVIYGKPPAAAGYAGRFKPESDAECW